MLKSFKTYKVLLCILRFARGKIERLRHISIRFVLFVLIHTLKHIVTASHPEYYVIKNGFFSTLYTTFTLLKQFSGAVTIVLIGMNILNNQVRQLH